MDMYKDIYFFYLKSMYLNTNGTLSQRVFQYSDKKNSNAQSLFSVNLF